MIDKSNLSVIYSGDHSDYRRKAFGATLIDQALMSIKSIRNNWSSDIPIYFTHTEHLPDSILSQMKYLNVQTWQESRYAFPEFPLGNKINFCTVPVETEFLLFLDCDTVVHKSLSIDSSADILVAYDALLALSEKDFRLLFRHLKVEFPKGKFYDSPAFEYYIQDRQDIFPAWNSGVFFLRSKHRYLLAECWSNMLQVAYDRFSTSSWSFYLEQASFIASIIALDFNYDILPKGYNFICTPRARHLEHWDHNKIYIEHYAGNTSEPLKLAVDLGNSHKNIQ